ncbi:hypothetical protein A3D54_02200 [Candidatus Falkowbacteria bacterium RIFCSPHIGHO2_02_FULL_45_15]|uniref:DUF5667 domain-containing protein n=1 Tax=Candidatus Falkowbacteria bacterium RIFCSPHIGHO2_02_FULL_45_15 TaxID=1797987 RepID=A0A1F5RZ31_9BACT|nr:MAG: hypothetical protein A3D54_02200 [Candidatus Falkowbacteria bacterium RIFCSPHIGHO2_02_FULL_45_15]
MIQNKNIVIAALTIALAATVSLPALAQEQPPLPNIPQIPSGVQGMPEGIPENIPEGMSGGPLNGKVQMGPSEEQLQKIEAQKLKGQKQAAAGMEKGLKQMEAQYAKLEKNKIAVPAEIKAKLQKARAIVEAVKNAKTSEELEAIDTEEFAVLMDELGSAVGEIQKQAQMLVGLKKAAKGMQKTIATFENQIAKLTKRGLTIPPETTDNLKKIKAIIAAINANKSIEELEALGWEEIGDIMDQLGESRRELEMLARWPQAVKQIDKEITNLGKVAKKLETTVNKLKTKEIDLTENLAKFKTGLEEIKAARAAAEQTMKSGDAAGAFDALEENVFGKISEIYEEQRVIETMANLGRFAADYKKGIASAQQQINSLKKKKINTAELEDILNRTKTKGNEVLALLKAKPLDEEAIVDGLEALSELRNEFGDKLDELGGGAAMPWEQGKQQFQAIQLPKEFQQFSQQLQVKQPAQQPAQE